MIQLTLWGDEALKFEHPEGTYLLLESLIIKDFKGKSLSTVKSTRINTNIPDIPEYTVLLKNISELGSKKIENISAGQKELSEMKLYSIKEMGDNAIGNLVDMSEKMYFSVFGYLIQIPNRLFYESCPIETCKKKVTMNDYKTYDCEKCGKSYDKFMPRYIANLKFSDCSGSQYCLTAGADHCKKIFGMSEEALYTLMNNNQDDFHHLKSDKVYVLYKLRVVAKLSTYNNETKVKYTINDIKPVSSSYRYYTKALLKLVEKED